MFTAGIYSRGFRYDPTVSAAEAVPLRTDMVAVPVAFPKRVFILGCQNRLPKRVSKTGWVNRREAGRGAASLDAFQCRFRLRLGLGFGFGLGLMPCPTALLVAASGLAWSCPTVLPGGWCVGLGGVNTRWRRSRATCGGGEAVAWEGGSGDMSGDAHRV